MDTKIVTIDLGARSYDIYIGERLIYRLHEFVPAEIKNRTAFFITDENVRNIAAVIRDNALTAGAARAEMLVLPPGEKTKSFAQIERVCDWLLSHEVNRHSVIFAIGGGVIGDLTGFAAAIVMRGVSFVQVPTTLLSQVDSSVGGKTGINTALGKNLVGAFYQPVSVIADIDVLKSLPPRELLAGYAEVVKYALIGDIGFFEWLEENAAKVCALEPDEIIYAIEMSVRAKAAIVQSDEKESGRRALLNFGHTFGHALETVAKYDGRLLHGEAVAIGMIMAMDLSVRMELCTREQYDRVEQHFLRIGLPTSAALIEPRLKTSASELISIMKKDKKVADGKMTFILSRGIGDAFVTQDVPETLVRDVLEESMGESAREKGIKGLWKSAFSSR